MEKLILDACTCVTLVLLKKSVDFIKGLAYECVKIDCSRDYLNLHYLLSILANNDLININIKVVFKTEKEIVNTISYQL